MDLSIVSEHKFCVLRGLGQRPNKHETGGFRANGIRLFSQSGYRFALLAAFLPHATMLSCVGTMWVITVYSNIHTRIGEIGMQRAIGMSAASLYKTFLWEGAYYGIFASAIGAVLGYVCCIFVSAAQTDTLQLVAVPVAAILEAAAVSVAACLAATAIPLRAISRMSIVDSIETGE